MMPSREARVGVRGVESVSYYDLTMRRVMTITIPCLLVIARPVFAMWIDTPPLWLDTTVSLISLRFHIPLLVIGIALVMGPDIYSAVTGSRQHLLLFALSRLVGCAGVLLFGAIAAFSISFFINLPLLVCSMMSVCGPDIYDKLAKSQGKNRLPLLRIPGLLLLLQTGAMFGLSYAMTGSPLGWFAI